MTFEKKKKVKKITLSKVQTAFNQAIVRRDKRCILSGSDDNLQCSHFFAVGGSGSLRFYPPNAHAMSAGEHINFHNRNVLPYAEWMQENISELDWMSIARKRSIKYNQEVLGTIFGLCRNDELSTLQRYIESKLGGKDD
jgi:hypothetical protein